MAYQAYQAHFGCFRRGLVDILMHRDVRLSCPFSIPDGTPLLPPEGADALPPWEREGKRGTIRSRCRSGPLAVGFCACAQHPVPPVELPARGRCPSSPCCPKGAETQAGRRVRGCTTSCSPPWRPLLAASLAPKRSHPLSGLPAAAAVWLGPRGGIASDALSLSLVPPSLQGVKVRGFCAGAV